MTFLENDGGNDKFFGSKYAEEVTGGAGNDTFFGNGGNDTLQGGLGHDYLSGGNGNDILEGENGNDIINGGAGENDMVGGSGADRIDNWHGEGGVIYGDKDDDLIIPGNNTRVYSGTKLVNQSSGGGRIQSVDGGSDTIEFSAAGNRITIDLDLIDQWQIYDGSGRSLLFGDQFENLIGSPQADNITVDPLSKTRKLDGAKGYDTLHIDCKKKDVILTPTHIMVDGYAPMRVVSFEVIDLQNAGTITRKKTAVTSTITPLLLFE